jgi:hypothetical protein
MSQTYEYTRAQLPRVQDPDVMDAICESEDVRSSEDPDDGYLEIENAFPGSLLQLQSSMLRTASSRRTLPVEFDIVSRDVLDVPQYNADPYRATSISAVMPLPGEISTWWKAVPYPYASKGKPRQGRYPTRRDARVSVREKQAYDHALAIRSAIIMAMEPCVDNTPYRVWPEYVDAGEKVTFGWCPFPDRQRETQTCNDQRDDNDQVGGRAGDSDILTNAEPSMVPDIITVRNATKTMVWAGYTRSCNAPTHLRGAPDQCLVYRRVVKDLNDNNKTLDDTDAVLYASMPH